MENQKEEKEPIKTNQPEAVFVNDKNPDTDSDGTNPELEKELLERAEEKEQAEKEMKFVIIGGNEPSINKSILDSINNTGIDISVFELTVAEMKFIINSRAEVRAQETSAEYIKNDENKKRIQDWCRILIQNYINKYYTLEPEQREELIKSAYDGKKKILMERSRLKKVSGLSWSQFKELFGTLKLFGVVESPEGSEDEFYLLVDTEMVTKNKEIEITEMLKMTKGKIDLILESENMSDDSKKRMKSLRTKVNNLLK